MQIEAVENIISYQDLIKKTLVNRTYEEEFKKVYSIITNIENINKMIVAIDMGFCPLAGIVKELEEKVDCSNVCVRQGIGIMIKYLLAELGYKGTDKRYRIQFRFKTEYIKTGCMYELSDPDPRYVIRVSIEKKH